MSAAPAFSGSTRDENIAGNTSGAAGAGGSYTGPTTAQEEGHTLGNDFSLRGIDTGREEVNKEPNVLPGESLSTAGPGGDYRERGLEAHEAKGLKQRLERDDERAFREAQGYDEPENRRRMPPNA